MAIDATDAVEMDAWRTETTRPRVASPAAVWTTVCTIAWSGVSASPTANRIR